MDKDFGFEILNEYMEIMSLNEKGDDHRRDEYEYRKDFSAISTENKLHNDMRKVIENISKPMVNIALNMLKEQTAMQLKNSQTKGWYGSWQDTNMDKLKETQEKLNKEIGLCIRTAAKFEYYLIGVFGKERPIVFRDYLGQLIQSNNGADNRQTLNMLNKIAENYENKLQLIHSTMNGIQLSPQEILNDIDHLHKLDTLGKEFTKEYDAINRQKSLRKRPLPSSFGSNMTPTVRKYVNILLLSVKGVEMSTFINAFANYITFPSLEDAMNAEPIVKLDSKITLTIPNTHERKEIELISGASDAKEQSYGAHGCMSHIIPYRTYNIRLVSAPDIDDVVNIDSNTNGLENIFTYISQYEDMHCICILLNVSNDKEDAILECRIRQLLSYLDKGACKNIVFMFTNAKTTYYMPTREAKILNDILMTDDKKTNINIPYEKQRIYSMEYDAFKILITYKNFKNIGAKEMKNLDEYWKISNNECQSLMKYIIGTDGSDGLRAHPIRNIKFINEARRLLIRLEQPLIEIRNTIEQNYKQINSLKSFINIETQNLSCLNQNLYIVEKDLMLIQLKHDKVVCANTKCCEEYNMGGVLKKNYVTTCHEKCACSKSIVKNMLGGNNYLHKCKEFRNHYCTRCSCHSSQHLLISYDTKVIEKQIIDKNVESEIQIKEQLIKDKLNIISNNEIKGNDLIKERDIITITSAKLAYFLRQNCILIYNDKYNNYFDHMNAMNDFASKTQHSTQSMKEMLSRYNYEKAIFDRSLENNNTYSDVNENSILKELSHLCRLNINGKLVEESLKNNVSNTRFAGDIEMAVNKPSQFKSQINKEKTKSEELRYKFEMNQENFSLNLDYKNNVPTSSSHVGHETSSAPTVTERKLYPNDKMKQAQMNSTTEKYKQLLEKQKEGSISTAMQDINYMEKRDERNINVSHGAYYKEQEEVDDYEDEYDDYVNISEQQTKKNEINILVMGETGVGKSTFINAFVNYLTYETLYEAENDEDILSLIPSSFNMTDMETFKQKQIQFGDDDNENYKPGESATQMCKSYVFPFGNSLVRLIDTPGVGDTRGMSQDNLNFENVLDYIAQYESLHCICILMKPNNARITVTFEFCIKQLLSHLQKDASRNIVFLFTNARSTFYRPGDSAPALTSLLDGIKKKPPYVDISFDKKTIYCMDNEAFRFLVALKNNINFKEEEINNFAKSWKYSSEECLRLMKHIMGTSRTPRLEPHRVQDTISVNEARRVIVRLSQPLADIVQNIEDNLKRMGEHVIEMKSAEYNTNILKTKIFIPQLSLEITTLKQPKTVCANLKCCDVYNVGGRERYNYKTECHSPCHLKMIQRDVLGDPGLMDCKAFVNGNCSVCRCNYKNHLHVYYDSRLVERQIRDPKVERDITNTQMVKIHAMNTIHAINDRANAMKFELTLITKTTALFSHFLKSNAIAPYNDSFKAYLKHLIDNEEALAMRGSNNVQTITGLKQMLANYEQEKSVLEDAIKGTKGDKATDVSAQAVFDSIDKLYSLRIYGKKIKATLQKQTVSRMNEETAKTKETIFKPRFLKGFGATINTQDIRDA